MLMMIVERRRSVSVRLTVLISFLFISGLAADDSSTSSTSVGLKVLFVCLAIVAAVAFSVMLYKFWQKKKRAEQHARLLKLFEDDDELEVELGIRD
ncbi:unnamed protein product [Rhodiola kirilowii]